MDVNIFVIYSKRYQSTFEIHGYAITLDEAKNICASHNAMYPYAPQYKYFETGRLHGSGIDHAIPVTV